jgi:hypothetical protein
MANRFTVDWQERILDLIPLLLALAVTRRLNLQGWRSLVACVLIAGTTREIMGQLATESQSLSRVGDGPLNAAEKNGQGYSASTKHPHSETETPGKHQIIHTSPGRIRLRLPRLAKNLDYAADLQPHLAADQRLQSVRVNPHTASVTVKYDVQQFREPEILDALGRLLDFAPEGAA